MYTNFVHLKMRFDLLIAFCTIILIRKGRESIELVPNK